MGPHFPHARRHERHWRWLDALPIVVAAVLLLAVATTAATVELLRARRAVLADGARTTEGLARLAAEQTAHTTQAVDVTLGAIVDLLESAPATPRHSATVEAFMRKRLLDLPYVRALFVIGPDGRVTQHTDRDTPDLSLADRPYFKAHQQEPQLGLHVGPPLLSRAAGAWFLSMSRRIDAPGGAFGGVAVAAVEPRYFQRLYGSLDVGEDGMVTLLLRDLSVVARHPHHEPAVGRPFAEEEPLARHLRTAPAGTFTATSRVDGLTRLVSYRTVPESPLVVRVGLSVNRLLAPWRAQAWIVGGTTAVLGVLLASVAWLLVAQQRRRRPVRARLAEARRLQAVGRLAMRLGGELCNLTTVVLGNLVLLARTADEPELRSLAGTAEQAARRLQVLAGQLRTAGSPPGLREGTVSLDEGVARIAALMRDTPGPEVTVERGVDPAEPACRVERARLEPALLALVLGAREATPKDGRVVIRTQRLEVRPGSARPHGLPSGSYAHVTITGTGRRAASDSSFEVPEVHALVREAGGRVATADTAEGLAVHLCLPVVEHPPKAAAPSERAVA